jgi:DNA polymerase III sliding clamp (beta) subunit (PCNA family)
MTKFTITNKALKGPLSLAATIAPASSTLPILENIMFMDGKLVASDSQAQISIACPVSGNFTASAEKLKKITAAFADDAELSFDVQKYKLTVKSGKSKLTMPVLGCEGFPVANMEGEPQVVTLKQEDIKFHLQNVLYAIGQNNVIQWMNNLLFLNGKYAAATNLGMAVSEQDVEQEYKFSIPGKATGQLLKFLNDGDAVLHIYKNKVVFLLGDVEFICPIANQEHPDVFKFIPRLSMPITFNRAEFLDMSSRASINASKFAGAKFILSCQELTLECKDFGADSVDSMSVKYDGPDIEFGYNILQLRAAVTSIRSDVVTMHVATNGTALVLSDDSMQKNVLTCMRI